MTTASRVVSAWDGACIETLHKAFTAGESTTFTADDKKRADELTGTDPANPSEFFNRDNGARFLVSVKVVCDRVPSMSPVSELLSR